MIFKLAVTLHQCSSIVSGDILQLKMRIFLTLFVSVATIANAYVPSHMELPDTWRDVSTATVR